MMRQHFLFNVARTRYHPQILTLTYRTAKTDGNPLAKQRIANSFLLESFVDKTTLNSQLFDKTNDFFTT